MHVIHYSKMYLVKHLKQQLTKHIVKTDGLFATYACNLKIQITTLKIVLTSVETKTRKPEI